MFCMHVQYVVVCLFKCIRIHIVSKSKPMVDYLRFSKTKRKTKIEPHHLFWMKITNVKFTDMVRLLWVVRGWVNAAAAAACHTRVLNAFKQASNDIEKHRYTQARAHMYALLHNSIHTKYVLVLIKMIDLKWFFSFSSFLFVIQTDPLKSNNKSNLLKVFIELLYFLVANVSRYVLIVTGTRYSAKYLI